MIHNIQANLRKAPMYVAYSLIRQTQPYNNTVNIYSFILNAMARSFYLRRLAAIAFVAAHTTPVLTQSVDIVYSHDIGHSINAHDGVHECPDVQVLGIEHSRLAFRIEELTLELESAEVNLSQHQLNVTRKDEEIFDYQILLQEAMSELAAAISERNDSFQNFKSLQEKMERMEQEHLKIMNNTETEMMILRQDLERRKRQVKSTEDRYHDTRKKLAEVDRELRKMHKRAISQYVNFTNMANDAWSQIEKTTAKANNIVESRWGRQYRRLRPRIQRANRHVKNMYRNAESTLRQKLTSLQRKMMSNWHRSTIFRPYSENTWKQVSSLAGNIYLQHEPAINEAKEACHLSAISIIEEISKSVISFLDASVKEREERMKKLKEQRNDPISRHKDRMKRHKDGFGTDEKRDKDDEFVVENIKPTILHLKTREFCTWVLDNSVELVKRGTAMMPLALTLIVSKSVVVGLVLLYFGVPYEFVWFVGICRCIRSKGKKNCD